jgi:hypothetical protein
MHIGFTHAHVAPPPSAVEVGLGFQITKLPTYPMTNSAPSVFNSVVIVDPW